MAMDMSLQDSFLSKLRTDQVPVYVYLTNGIKLQGCIGDFDQFVVLLKNSLDQIIYKHAISTIVPTGDVKI